MSDSAFALYTAMARVSNAVEEKGFTWIKWSRFLPGLVESFFDGIYFGLVYVSLYNSLQAKEAIQ